MLLASSESQGLVPHRAKGGGRRVLHVQPVAGGRAKGEETRPPARVDILPDAAGPPLETMLATRAAEIATDRSTRRRERAAVGVHLTVDGHRVHEVHGATQVQVIVDGALMTPPPPPGPAHRPDAADGRRGGGKALRAWTGCAVVTAVALARNLPVAVSPE